MCDSAPEQYRWQQSLNEVTVVFPLAGALASVRGKEIAVAITPKAVAVTVRGERLAGGPLHRAVAVDESLWTLEGGELTVLLEKARRDEWWAGVWQGHAGEIDVTRVEPEQAAVGDLDPNMQATVKKMMFDQRQKELGLPSSDEITKQEALAKFMAQHPELDFSNAVIQK